MELSKYIGSKIRYYRELKNLTQDELAEQLGTTRQSISRYETGERKANQDILFELADIFKISINKFFPSVENVSSIETIYNQLEPPRQAKVYNFAEYQLKEQNNKVVPLLGGAAANPTELSYGDSSYGETVEVNVPEKADCALVVKGDSMEPEYYNGDIVFYKTQPVIENGETAIVEINGDGVTLKKVYFNYDEDKVILRSLNNKYADRELNPDQVRILGKVVK